MLPRKRKLERLQGSLSVGGKRIGSRSHRTRRLRTDALLSPVTRHSHRGVPFIIRFSSSDSRSRIIQCGERTHSPHRHRRRRRVGPGPSFGVPFVGSRAQGLGGVLPALPWERYTACGLEGNHWACPLPDPARTSTAWAASPSRATTTRPPRHDDAGVARRGPSVRRTGDRPPSDAPFAVEGAPPTAAPAEIGKPLRPRSRPTKNAPKRPTRPRPPRAWAAARSGRAAADATAARSSAPRRAPPPHGRPRAALLAPPREKERESKRRRARARLV